MKRVLLLFVTLALLVSNLEAKESCREKRKARNKAKTEEVRRLIESRDMRFIAQIAHPMGGGSIHLTSEYTLDITDDKVVSYLPYFGVAYTSEYGSSEGGIKFSETADVIKWTEEKKIYEIVMDVRAPRDLYRLHLSVTPAGYGTLDVSSQNRQAIHFSGIVVSRPPDQN